MLVGSGDDEVRGGLGGGVGRPRPNQSNPDIREIFPSDGAGDGGGPILMGGCWVGAVVARVCATAGATDVAAGGPAGMAAVVGWGAQGTGMGAVWACWVGHGTLVAWGGQTGAIIGGHDGAVAGTQVGGGGGVGTAWRCRWLGRCVAPCAAAAVALCIKPCSSNSRLLHIVSGNRSSDCLMPSNLGIQYFVATLCVGPPVRFSLMAAVCDSTCA